jgi:hypothetical protein
MLPAKTETYSDHKNIQQPVAEDKAPVKVWRMCEQYPKLCPNNDKQCSYNALKWVLGQAHCQQPTISYQRLSF